MENMWYTYTMEYYPALKKNEIMLLTGEMGGTGEHYIKSNKPGSQRQISCFLIFGIYT
jgi:hypothetical protein